MRKQTGYSHFDIAGLLVVTEGAGELGVQVPSQLLLGWRLPLRLSASHAELLTICGEKLDQTFFIPKKRNPDIIDNKRSHAVYPM
jgi:hypothetical protein